MTPKIAVIMPVHDAARTLDAAIESILGQTFEGFELIAVDDGSTDDSLEKLKEWAQVDDRIRVFSLSERCGIAKALNFGIEQTRSELIARMDADDISLPQRLEHQVAYFELWPSVIAAGTWVRFIDETGLPIYTYRTPLENAVIESELLLGNGGAMVHPSLLIRRSALESIRDDEGNIYRSQCDTFEDLDLYYRLMPCGDLANVGEVLLLYRQHFGNTNFSDRKFSYESLKFQRINAARASYGLKPLDLKSKNVTHYELFQQWAGWALCESYWYTAFKYAMKVLLSEPWCLHSWRFMKFVFVSFLSQLKRAKQPPSQT